jgi:hypothetical protein
MMGQMAQVASKSPTMSKRRIKVGHYEGYAEACDFQITDHDEAVSNVEHNRGYNGASDLQVSDK